MQQQGIAYRILPAIGLNLRCDGFIEVYSQYAAQPHEVDGDIGKLIANCSGGERIVAHLSGLILGKPLEDFNQLSDFAGQCHCNVFGGVELIPITFVSERLQARLESCHVNKRVVGAHNIEVVRGTGASTSTRPWSTTAGSSAARATSPTT